MQEGFLSNAHRNMKDAPELSVIKNELKTEK